MGAWKRAMYPHIYIWIFDEAITTFILAIVAVHVLKLRNPQKKCNSSPFGLKKDLAQRKFKATGQSVKLNEPFD